jgi:O-antigen/teichoic acid export membrane protein
MTIASGDLAGRLFGFLTTVYLARTLQPESFGLITIGMAALGYLLLAASPGIQIVEARNVAAGSIMSTTAIADVLGLRILLALALWLLTAVVATVMLGSTPLRDVVILYAASLLPLAVLLDWYFAGREDFGIVGIGRGTTALAILAVTIVLVRTVDDVRGAPVAFTAGSMLGATVFAVAFRKNIGTLHIAWNPRGWGEVLRRNLPVGMATILGQSAMNLPPIIVGAMLTPSDTGVLGAAQRLIPAILLADRVIHSLLLPVMTRYWSVSAAESKRIFAVTFRLVAVAAVPGAVLGAAFAPAVIGVVYGAEYAAAAPVFSILLGYVVLTLLNTVSLALVLAAGRDRAYARIMVLSASALAVLLLILTPMYGVRGAAAGVVLGELVAFLLLGREVHALLGMPPGALLLKLLPPVAVMGRVITFGGGVVSAGGVAAAGIGAFVLTALLTRVLTREEWTFVKGKLL